MGFEIKYFVLKPRGTDAYAQASREAMQAYSNSIRKHDIELSEYLYDWRRDEEEKSVRQQVPTPDGFGAQIEALEAKLADEMEATTKALDLLRLLEGRLTDSEAKLAALVDVAQRLIDRAKNREQEEWAGLADVLDLQDAIVAAKVTP